MGSFVALLWCVHGILAVFHLVVAVWWIGIGWVAHLFSFACFVCLVLGQFASGLIGALGCVGSRFGSWVSLGFACAGARLWELTRLRPPQLA